jgi:hypothetical protein
MRHPCQKVHRLRVCCQAARRLARRLIAHHRGDQDLPQGHLRGLSHLDDYHRYRRVFLLRQVLPETCCHPVSMVNRCLDAVECRRADHHRRQGAYLALKSGWLRRGVQGLRLGSNHQDDLEPRCRVPGLIRQDVHPVHRMVRHRLAHPDDCRVIRHRGVHLVPHRRADPLLQRPCHQMAGASESHLTAHPLLPPDRLEQTHDLQGQRARRGGMGDLLLQRPCHQMAGASESHLTAHHLRTLQAPACHHRGAILIDHYP